MPPAARVASATLDPALLLAAASAALCDWPKHLASLRRRHQLTPPVFFGLLGESHEWKNAEDPKEKIRKLADDLDRKVKVPREGLDMLCIADLGY